jgi:hypothetical protein
MEKSKKPSNPVLQSFEIILIWDAPTPARTTIFQS